MPTRLDFAKLDLKDALDLAILIEAEAYDRYRQFADQLGHRAEGDAADVFLEMADNEGKHGRELLARRKKMFGDAPHRVSRDDLFDVEAPEQGAPRAGMSTRRAFEVALASEQKAYDFYHEALDHVRDESVRELFQELRDEEVDHLRMVRTAIENLPASADEEWEQDEDDLPAL